MDNIAIVLQRTQLAENIGSTARAMANMGLSDLRVVAPRDTDRIRMEALATAKGRPVLEAMQVYDHLGDALADRVHVAATTARTGDLRGRLANPRAAAPTLLGWAAQAPVAVIFGPEDTGLSNQELAFARLSINIPTEQNASSLNLAQAVLIIAYELFWASRDNLSEAPLRGPAPAPQADLLALKEHLAHGLTAIGALPADNPEHFFRYWSAVLDRAAPSTREIRALHGAARQMLWLAGQGDEGGE